MRDLQHNTKDKNVSGRVISWQPVRPPSRFGSLTLGRDVVRQARIGQVAVLPAAGGHEGRAARPHCVKAALLGALRRWCPRDGRPASSGAAAALGLQQHVLLLRCKHGPAAGCPLQGVVAHNAPVGVVGLQRQRRSLGQRGRGQVLDRLHLRASEATDDVIPQRNSSTTDHGKRGAGTPRPSSHPEPSPCLVRRLAGLSPAC